jgi:hypothetical protein
MIRRERVPANLAVEPLLDAYVESRTREEAS